MAEWKDGQDTAQGRGAEQESHQRSVDAGRDVLAYLKTTKKCCPHEAALALSYGLAWLCTEYDLSLDSAVSVVRDAARDAESLAARKTALH